MQRAFDLATHSLAEPRCVLLRHAERPPLQPGTPGTNLELTKEGKRASLALGQSLDNLASIRTSPLRRCTQTAEYIRKGSQTNTQIVPDTILGDPGVYIEDPERAWQNWLHFGQDSVLEHLAHGRSLPGFADLKQATRRLFDHLLGQVSTSGTHLAITHDSVMIPLLAVIRGEPVGVTQYPSYLESIVLTRAKGKTCAHFRGRQLAEEW